MRTILAFPLLALAACTMPGAPPEPSLAPRAAEAIDPRVPIPNEVPSGPVDPALVARLEALVGAAGAGVSSFEAREAIAARLAASAGPAESESWIAAQQALSRLIEQYGVTTRVAAEIDSIAAARLETQRWIRPADRRAIDAAAARVAVINDAQAASIARLRDRLSR